MTQSLFMFVLISSARVLLSLYALELGAQPFAVGTIGAMLYVMPLILVWGVGMLFDRFGARWLIMFGSFCGMLGMLLPFFWHSLLALYGAAALFGMSLAFINVVQQGLVGQLSEPSERTRNFSTYSMIASTGNFAGPLLTGFSIDLWGHAPTCLLLSLAPLIGLLIMAARGNLLPRAGVGTEPLGSPLKTLADPDIRHMLVVNSLMQLGIDLFQFYLPIYGHGLGISASAIGVVLGAHALAAFVSRAVLPRLVARLGEETLLSWSFFFGAVFFLLVPFSHSAAVLALISFLFGLCVGCGGPLTLILMFSHSARQGRPGEVLGLRLTANYLTRMTGPVVFGFIASLLGLLPVFFLNALLMCAGGVLSRPRGNALPARPAASEGRKRQE